MVQKTKPNFLKSVSIIYRNKNKFAEFYCSNCQKILGRYNTEYYDSNKIQEILKSHHSFHLRKGHQVIIRNIIKETWSKFFKIKLKKDF